MPSAPTIYGPDEIALEGRRGLRYWLRAPVSFTGHAHTDEHLSGYPVALFLPPHRPSHQTPVVVGIQGLAAPYQWNAFLVPTLLDMGLACILFDAPAAGERGLARRPLADNRADILDELTELVRAGAPISLELLPGVMDAVARDCATVLGLAAERHGLTDGRHALFGVSFGTLLASHAFLRDGVGERLLGTIGHADLPAFARSYSPPGTGLLGTPPLGLLSRLPVRLVGPRAVAALAFLRVLARLARSRGAVEANPMHYAERVGPGRRVRFLVGEEDRLVRPADAIECARRFPDGACYVVPGLGHGGGGFVEHARYFVRTQLGDWAE